MKKSNVTHNYAVVVAGGKGTRLWPLSRENLPKQMQKLVGEKSLIEDTIDRIVDVVPLENIIIATTKQYEDTLREMLPQIPKDNFIIEPSPRGTTVAFALFSEVIYRRDPKAIILSLASDHAVGNTDEFHRAARNAYEVAATHKNSITLVSITPTHADTGLGYIKVDQKIQEEPLVYSVEKFIEKPSRSVAEVYLASKEYYWNAAYYCYAAKTLIDAYNEADPNIMAGITAYLKTGKDEDFEKTPIKAQEIELINAKAFPIYTIPASIEWSDIGNWGALHGLLAKMDEADNTVVGSDQHVDVESINCMIVADNPKKIITTVGLNNIVIVDTHDALLVLNKEKTEDLKKAIESIKEKGLVDYL